MEEGPIEKKTWRESAKSATKTKEAFSREEVEVVLGAVCKCALARGLSGEEVRKLCEES